MLAYELCEKNAEQEKKENAREYGKPTATTVRLNQWWSGAGRRVIIADAWFGSLRTAYALFYHGFHSICNVKGQTKGFCKQDLFDAAKEPGQKELQRNATASKRRR